jgi:hypothetical protein
MPCQVNALVGLAEDLEHLLEPHLILGRPKIAQRHAGEFLARVAVLRDRGIIDVEDRGRVVVIDPHRRRIVLEQQTIARLALGENVSRSLAFPVRCPRLSSQHEKSNDKGNDEREHGDDEHHRQCSRSVQRRRRVCPMHLNSDLLRRYQRGSLP